MSSLPVSSRSAPKLPAPDPNALAHGERVVAHIQAEIERAGGWIPFQRYMELALYAPGLGYYAGGAAKLGATGDFITAPEMTPLFGRSLARVAASVLAETGGDLLELGAGSGRLALDVLLELECLDSLPQRYRILEVSPDLRQRQQSLIAERAGHLFSRLEWLDSLPASFTGMILGNEVLDALPVHLVHWRDGVAMERGVAWRENGFAWEDRPAPSQDFTRMVSALPVEGDYLSEICPAASALVASLAACLQRGLILFIDYGFPRAEYYHPQRHMGTLRVHYRHHSLDDPFFLPGLADITAHMDFSAVAQAGAVAGLELVGYTSQAHFLMDAGLLDLMLEMEPMTPEYLRAASAVQKLLQPTEMGELFKVIALGKGVSEDLPGFQRGDRRGAL
jgi:SAM-dependent MidA family methyltransferase